MSLELYLAADCPFEEKSEDQYSIDNLLPSDEQYWVWPRVKPYRSQSAKKYFADFDWNDYTDGRACSFIGYLRRHLADVQEIEFWRTWDNNKPLHPIIRVEIELDALKPEDIRIFVERRVDTDESPTDYCLVIKR